MTERRCVAPPGLVVHVMPVTLAQIEPGLVERLFRLMPEEAEIAVLLAEGWTIRQMASAAGRKFSTVRTHLKPIFAKLGTSRQFEKAQAVLAFSSLPRAQD